MPMLYYGSIRQILTSNVFPRTERADTRKKNHVSRNLYELLGLRINKHPGCTYFL